MDKQEPYSATNPYMHEGLKLTCGAYFEIDQIIDEEGAIGHVLVSGEMIGMSWNKDGAVKDKGERIILNKFEVVITKIYDFTLTHKYYEKAKNNKVNHQ